MPVKNSIDWIELATHLFNAGGRKTYHVDELSDIGIELGIVPLGEDRESFSKKLNGFLARNVKSKTAQFSKVKNKSGGYRRGIYRIKPQKTINFTPVAPKVTTGFTGAAGEYAVLSELLFRGFNASKMTVDDGIDVVASKDERYFHVQVKTANPSSSNTYQASIRAKAFQHSSNVFYVIVLRTYSTVRYINDFAIFPSSEIRRLKTQGILKDSDTISLRISIENGRYLLNRKYDVTHHINDWECIV